MLANRGSLHLVMCYRYSWANCVDSPMLQSLVEKQCQEVHERAHIARKGIQVPLHTPALPLCPSWLVGGACSFAPPCCDELGSLARYSRWSEPLPDTLMRPIAGSWPVGVAGRIGRWGGRVISEVVWVCLSMPPAELDTIFGEATLELSAALLSVPSRPSAGTCRSGKMEGKRTLAGWSTAPVVHLSLLRMAPASMIIIMYCSNWAFSRDANRSTMHGPSIWRMAWKTDGSSLHSAEPLSALDWKSAVTFISLGRYSAESVIPRLRHHSHSCFAYAAKVCDCVPPMWFR